MSAALPPLRLDHLLSHYGYCSRRESRDWLRAGRVTVNGAPAKSPSDKADPLAVLVDGAPVECPRGILALLHKPAGCVCSHDSREGPSVYDLLPAQWLRRNPPVTTVGRLDKDTTGVLLITDLGALVQRWTSPKHKEPKIYEVTVDADLRPELIPLFAAGTLVLEDEDKPCLPAKLEILGPRTARLELVEGRYHQVKRMFASQGCTVTRLHRSRFGEFELGGLAPGQWRLVPVEGVPHLESVLHQ
ncbi:MAG: rRNA pseudouridine synthase [Verrucomicrobia bacterium]|nr:rRNA pseudouridine synthase [Verrucomicrobiota bacterium]